MLTLDKETQVAKNFKLKEFQCRDGTKELKLDFDGVSLLQKLRDYFNKPIYVASGYRTKEYNTKIGGATNSYHTYGKAFDIKITGVNPAYVGYVAHKLGFNGIGIYDTDTSYFTHVDTRVEPKLFRDDITHSTTFDELETNIEERRF